MPRNKTVLLGGSGAGAITASAVGGGTTDQVAKFTGAFTIGDTSNIVDTSTGVGINKTQATPTHFLDIVAGSLTSTKNALKVTGTLSSTAATQSGVSFQITGAGNGSNLVFGGGINLLAGYTGSGSSVTQYLSNASAGTNTTAPTMANFFGNTAGMVYSGATTAGSNYGWQAQAENGNLNIALIGQAQTLKNAATNIGVVGFGLNTGTTPVHIGGYFGLHASGALPTFTSAALIADNGATTDPIFEGRDNGTPSFRFIDGGRLSIYRAVATAGWGVPAIYGSGRTVADTAANASIATYTVGAADGSFIISGNVNVTTSNAEAFNLQVSYTDETNTARTLNIPLAVLGGTTVSAVNFSNGAVPYSGIPVQIRAKAATAITIKTAGTFTGSTYNGEGMISQVN